MRSLYILATFLKVDNPLIYQDNFTNGEKHIMLILDHQFNMLKLDRYQIEIVLLKVSLSAKSLHETLYQE
jgi:hypothetical protein